MLRAIAAALVIVDHSILALIEKDGMSASYQSLAYALGNAGVALFFAISGFIMAYTSSKDFGMGRSGSFLLRRIKRIVPLYWLATTIYAGRLIIGGNPPSLVDFLKSLFFFPYLKLPEGLLQPVLGQGWTLNYEMYFYTVFSLAMLFQAWIGYSIIFLWLLLTVAAGRFLLGAGNPPEVSFYMSPIILFFLAGIIAYYFYRWLPRKLPRVESTVLVKAGDASYSTYLFHGFIIGPLVLAWTKIPFAFLPWPLFIVGAVLICSAVGYIVYRIVEIPMMSFWTRSKRSASD